jgi:nitrite reductase/ring-hydroxylating ferredoxin subunit
VETDVADDVIEISLAELRRLGVVRVSRPRVEALVVLVGGEIKAYSGVCPHLGGPLVDGEIRGDRIICPWHRYEWSLTTRKCFTVPGRIWDGVEGYTRPTSPYSRHLAPLSFELTEHSVRLKLPPSQHS